MSEDVKNQIGEMPQETGQPEFDDRENASKLNINQEDVEKALSGDDETKPTKKTPFDWPLTETQTRVSTVGLFALVVFLVVTLIFKPRTPASVTLPVNNAREPHIPQVNSDSDDTFTSDETVSKPPPMIVDFTYGQSSMVYGAQSLPSGSIKEKLLAFFKSYGTIIGFVLWTFGTALSSRLSASLITQLGMVAVAAAILYAVYKYWPTGPEGEKRSDLAKYVFKQILLVLVILAAAALAVAGLYMMVPSQVWADSDKFLAAHLPLVHDILTAIYRTGHRLLPF